MPTFSIIVPVYKTEKFLEKCITSILTQSYSDFELILVDDGSPDLCPQICDKYSEQDSRVKVYHKRNGGVSSARNLGISVAIGTYIWFVDSDDYIEPFSLQYLFDVQSNHKADMYIFNNRIVHDISISLESIDDFFQKYYFTYIPGFGPWNKLYRRNIIQKYNLQFDIQETIGEDLLFNINYYKVLFEENKKKIFFIGQNFYHYVDRADSAMNTFSKERVYQQLRLFDKIQRCLTGILSDENMKYLFLMHLVSGIKQSADGGMTSEEFAEIDWKKYRSEIDKCRQIEQFFLKNENASFMGKLRMHLFLRKMCAGDFVSAGKIMGLK